VAALVEAAAHERQDSVETFSAVWDLAWAAGGTRRSRGSARLRVPTERPPRLTEAWFC
jgi:hypothetical protein